jgi:uncharacterized protein (TIGR03000 family)
MLMRSFLLVAMVVAAGLPGAQAQAPPWTSGYYAGVVSGVGYYPGYVAPGFYPGYWDSRHAWDYFPYGRYDYGLNYFGTAPTTSSYSAYYPAPAPVSASAQLDDDSAHLAVRVPPDAALWFDGFGTLQTGGERLFVSPPLAPGQDYTYEIRARWTEDGRPVDRVRTVHVRANTRAEVDMLRAP